MHILISILASWLLTNYVQAAVADPSFKPVQPPAYPLAVTNPYLNAWLPGNQAVNLPFASAQFWTGNNLTWSIIARVDGKAHSLFGVPSLGFGVDAGFLQSAEYTSTHTTFVVNAGSASFVLDFLSPVSPQNYVRQSAPFSYLTISVSGINGATPDVQLYTDIDNTWIGHFPVEGDDYQLNWGYVVTNASTSIFTLTPGGVATYSELNDTAQWGTAVYCTRPNNSTLTAAVGELDVVRANFAANGSAWGPWEWEPDSVVAYSQDFGKVTQTTNVTFAISYWRQAAVDYLGDARTAYFTATCPDTNCACVHVMDDFEAADAEARTLDAEIAAKANSVAGANYSDIVELSVRQTFGAIDLTIPLDTLNTSDVLAFVKEISSDGNVNTVDVIYPMAPIFYVLAPEYIRLLLEPVMRYLASGAWPLNYTVHDLGAAYPNATGHNNGTAEPMPDEECGDLLTLAYMYQLASGNKDWADQYQGIFEEYAQYLVVNGHDPVEQLSSDDSVGLVANQTGLAVKAAVALNAYGVMSGQQNYSDTGRNFAKTLYDDGDGLDSNRTHFTVIQGNDLSWGLQYNLFMDHLLNLSTFSPEALSMQTSFYPSVRMSSGVPLNSLTDWGKTDWMNFAAATAIAPGVGNGGVRDMFIDDVHAFMANGRNSVPFSDKFFVMDNGTAVAGGWDQYRARPVVGGHFALMALSGPNQFQLSGSGAPGGYSV